MVGEIQVEAPYKRTVSRGEGICFPKILPVATKSRTPTFKVMKEALECTLDWESSCKRFKYEN